MARIKLDPPNPVLFSTHLTVRVADINYGGHLGNDRLLGLLHEARILFFKHLGFEGEISIHEGTGIIMNDAALVYKSEAFLGDQLKINIGVEDVFAKGCDIKYLVNEVNSNRLIAIAKTGIVFFNYHLKKIADVPSVFLEKLKSIPESK